MRTCFASQWVTSASASAAAAAAAAAAHRWVNDLSGRDRHTDTQTHPETDRQRERAGLQEDERSINMQMIVVETRWVRLCDRLCTRNMRISRLRSNRIWNRIKRDVRNYRFLSSTLNNTGVWSLIELASLCTVPLSAVNGLSRLTRTSNGHAGTADSNRILKLRRSLISAPHQRERERETALMPRWRCMYMTRQNSE